jgi:HD-GYP domain-containing protein (c-di-GMP phosphodiesterase class II)
VELDQMQSIPIAELLRHEKLPVDVYIRADDRYLLIWKAGSHSVHLAKLTAKGLSSVFIRLQDHAQIVQQAIKTGGTEGAEENRLAGLHNAMTSVFSGIELMGFTDESFDHAKQVNYVTLSFVAKNPRLNDIFAKVSSLENDETKHLMTVSMFSAMLGIGHGWSKPGTIEKLSLIGFLHDVGKTKIPKDILDKPIEGMSKNERAIYDSHGEIGGQLLSQAKSVPDDVILAVNEHHEFADGSGFPRGIKDILISPLARVVSLANYLADELEENDLPDSKEKLSAVVERVMARPRLFNKDVILAMQKIVRAGQMKAAG